MDAEVRTPPKVKRAAQVRLEKLDADTVRQIARQTQISVRHLLREAVMLLTAKYREQKP